MSFANTFVDTALTFLIIHLIHFYFDIAFFSLLSKSFDKIRNIILLTKFACFTLAVNVSAVNLLSL